ncbi:CAP domain-containing protein [Deinococcus radiotolerans]|uniref:SCP domain-containing protein n=1 Tax=Deinococcus radiotolerans TaxID=1309407 RepID=A0ABQ2FKY1_9DEIO|nr:CAP domain-containing protein [Deinococcus radiotolerans]GGL04421.1 hypothetical protein GCM10010844_23900 [Deinococcus radiotolerans]
MTNWRRALWTILSGAALFALGLAGIWLAGWWPGRTVNQPPAPQLEAPATPPSRLPDPVASTPPPAQPVLDSPAVSPAPSEAAAPLPVPAPAAPDPAAAQQGVPQPVPAPAPTGERQPALETPLASVMAAPEAAATAAPPLLAGLNRVRARAGLPPVKAEGAWQASCAGHARYLVRADRAEHREDPASPFRSAAGEACAPGHYFVSSREDASPERALTYWVGGAFHLPQLIDPRLTRVAGGAAHDQGGDFRSALVLDVRRGLSGAGRYPVRFPAPGQVAPTLNAATGEWPDALAGCPAVPTRGAPVALLLGPAWTGAVTDVNVRVNDRPVGACLLTAATFTGANDGETRVGRNVLAAQGAALALPDAPLPAGADVSVRFSTTRGAVSWSFRTQP